MAAITSALLSLVDRIPAPAGRRYFSLYFSEYAKSSGK
jgi:hypothetical protein